MSSSGTTRQTDGWRLSHYTFSSMMSSSATDRGKLDGMMDAFADAGMVSVTGFPAAFREDRRRFQASLGACAAASAAARAHVFDDGTRRTTRECLAVAVAAFVVPEAATTADEVVAEATSTADEVMGCG